MAIHCTQCKCASWCIESDGTVICENCTTEIELVVERDVREMIAKNILDESWLDDPDEKRKPLGTMELQGV